MVANVSISLVVHHDKDEVWGPGPLHLLAADWLAFTQAVKATEQGHPNHQEKHREDSSPHLQQGAVAVYLSQILSVFSFLLSQ